MSENQSSLISEHDLDANFKLPVQKGGLFVNEETTEEDKAMVKESIKEIGLSASDFESGDSTTVFNTDGSITTTYSDGTVEHTVFKEDGSIVTTETKNSKVKTTTTVFNADGSISTTHTEGEATE